MNYQSLDALKTVEPIINEAAKAIQDSTRTIIEDAASGIIGIAGGGIIGGIIAQGLIYDLGKVGLSASGFTSGLKALGFGKSMMAGARVAFTIITLPAMAGYAFINHAANKKLLQEKERIYKAAIKVHDALIKELNTNEKLPSDRIQYLNKHNSFLQDVIEKLKADLEAESCFLQMQSSQDA